MIFGHGWGKLANFSNIAPNFPDPIGLGSTLSLGLAVGAEVFAALFIVLGLFTRWASIPLIITMAVAAFVAHGGDPFAKKEMALIYLAMYLMLFFTGPGKYSINRK